MNSKDGLLMPKEVEDIGGESYFDSSKNYSTPTGAENIVINTTQYYPSNIIERVNLFDKKNESIFVNIENIIENNFKSQTTDQQQEYVDARKHDIEEQKRREDMRKQNEARAREQAKIDKLKKSVIGTGVGKKWKF